MDGSDLDLDSVLRLVVAMVNFTGEIIAITERTDAITILLWFVAAVGIVLIWGAENITRKTR